MYKKKYKMDGWNIIIKNQLIINHLSKRLQTQFHQIFKSIVLIC